VAAAAPVGDSTVGASARFGVDGDSGWGGGCTMKCGATPGQRPQLLQDRLRHGKWGMGRGSTCQGLQRKSRVFA